MKYLLHTIVALFLTLKVFSQDIKYKNYTWEEKPLLHQLADEEQNEFEILLKNKVAIEYGYDKEDKFYEFFLLHKIIRVNSDEAIEQNNKIYLPMHEVVEVMMQKARVITKDGQVKELDESNIKEAVDDENKQSYRYFAVEGIEIGSEIEYFYLIKIDALYTGSNRIFQSEILTKNTEFEIITPSNLICLVKSYNGFPDMEDDTTLESKNRLHVFVETIPAIKDDELFSNYEPNLMQVNYKIDKNLLKGKNSLFSYSTAAEAIYKQTYVPISKTAQKKIDKLIKIIDIDDIADEEGKIRKIENYIKVNFPVLDVTMQGLDDVELILDNKVSNKRGITKLFAAIFNQLNIDHQIVLTSDRFDQRFDPEFEDYNFLDNYLIFFSSNKMHLAPSEAFYRLGIIPYKWTHNYGLYIKTVQIGDFKSGLGKVKFIDASDYNSTYIDIDMNISFNGSFTELPIRLKRTLAGYYAQSYQPYYDYIDDKQKKEINESLVDFISKDAELDTIEVENKGCEFFGLKPLIVNAEFLATAYIEKAGPKYLFKVGELIGEQAEMYKDDERKLEVENSFNHRYHREINFNIPEGYQINNLDAINLNVVYEDAGERTAAFISKYEVEGDKVKVIVDEYYKQIIFPLERFEDYRKVINAAADFNKIVLFIEGK